MKRNYSTRGHAALWTDSAGSGIEVFGSVELRGPKKHNTAATCAASWPLACHRL